MKHIYLLAFLVISIGNAAAQQVTFQKTYGGTSGDEGESVQQTTDGGYIITGNTYILLSPNQDVCLIKTNAYGDTLWTRTFGEAVIGYQGYSVCQTTDGGYIIAGASNFSTGLPDVCLIKTDANGDTLWTKSIGGAGADYAWSVQQTTDSGYVMVGITENFVTGTDIYLIKTNSGGDTLWTRSFGGGYSDNGYSVTETSDSGYVIAGSTLNLGASGTDVYLIKTDFNGNLLWSKTYGGTNTDLGNSVQQTDDGGYIITGSTNSFGAGLYDIYQIKTDNNGDTLWTKTYGGISGDIGNCVRQTSGGGYIIAATTSSFGAGSNDFYLIKTNASGNIMWTKTYGGNASDMGYSVEQTSDGGYIINGRTNSFGASDYDVYLIKTDSMGNSGCNQGGTATIVTTPATQVTTPVTMATSPPTIVTTPATVVGSGGTVTTLCTTVGIQSAIPNPQSAITISPNPATNNFTIAFPNIIHTATVSIYNILGETIFKENIANTSRKEITLTGINAGIYVVRVIADGVQYTNKLVVQ